ncbi:MAG: molybdopterin molybdotransferase MoeA [Fimbriiglobus sp.]
MLEVADALAVVLRQAKPLAPVPAAPTLGRVLATDVPADRDSPPFDKSMMDGYAVEAADGTIPRRIVGEVAAGNPGAMTVGTGEAARIFTGAPIPPGADTVVMQELAAVADGMVTFSGQPQKPGKNVVRRGQEMQAGDVVLPAGTVLTPVALGLLAAVGRTTVPQFPAATVAVLPTGSELVDAGTDPGPGQIRNSNGPMLLAQVMRAGGEPRNYGIAGDDRDGLRAKITTALAESDVLILAGGVSVGKFDLVPDVLREIGVEVHFHKVRMKPGKPLLFGTWRGRLVFGLPGNPVSAFVGFELFVRPALRILHGHRIAGPVRARLPLAAPLVASNDRPTYHPAALDGVAVRPLGWFGSADLRGLLAADALITLPAGDVRHEAGDTVDVVVV